MNKRFLCKLLALVLCAALLLPLAPAASATNSHTAAEGVAWALARANEGWCEDVDGSYGCQCVDLILAYYRYLVGYNVSGNAVDYTWNDLPAGWVRTNSPSPGDVVVWGAGAQLEDHMWADSTYGHIGIVTAVGSYLSTVETNTYNHTAAKAFSNRYLSTPACYIHPDFAPEGGTVDVNGYLDGVSGGDLGSYGTFDMYINGNKVATGVNDYCQLQPIGTQYWVANIKANSGYRYNGVYSGSTSGTVNAAGVIDIRLSFSKISPTGISMPAAMSLEAGQTYTLPVTFTPSDTHADRKGITWTSSDTSVATVDANGTVTARKQGQVTITAKSKSNTSLTAACEFTVYNPNITGEWKTASVLPENVTPDICDIEYRHTYRTTAETSPGSGWTKIAGTGVTTYVNDGGVYDSDFELATSDTCVYVGSYYYHYCGAGQGENVEHYWTDAYTDYHVAGDVGSFYVVDSHADYQDSRYTFYRIKWVSGQWADGYATCAAGRSALWYRRYQYQNRTAHTTYTWTKTGNWVTTLDSSAYSVEYRYRLKDLTEPSVIGLDVTTITPRDYTVVCHAVDDTGISKLVFSCWTDDEGVENAQTQQITVQNAPQDTEVSATFAIVDHNNARDVHYNTSVKVYDVRGNVAEYTSEDGRVFMPLLMHSSKKLMLPEDLAVIEAKAFEGDVGFGEAVLPEGVTGIDSRAFAECSRLTLINIPDSLVDIAEDAFEDSVNVVFLCASNNAGAAFARAHGIPYFTGE